MGGGSFSDITSQSGLDVSGDLHGASWGDYDNNGDLDLYQTLGASHGLGTKANYFFINEGSGFFVDMAAQAGIQDQKGRGRTPLWFDYDNDGYLDLFIANDKREDAPSRLLRNNGDGTFTDVTASSGLAGIERASGAYIADIDGDMKMDLILSSWRRVYLYLNSGDGTFKDITAWSGLSGINMVRDMAIGDYDNDYDEDIFVSRGTSGDSYSIDMGRLHYHVMVSGYEKGFDFAVNGTPTVEFDLYVLSENAPVDLIYIGSGKYHPDEMPFSLDASVLKNHGEPVRDEAGIYIWFDVLDLKWHIRCVGSTGLNVSCGGIVSPAGPGSVTRLNPVNIEAAAVEESRNILLQNQGSGQFIDVTDAAGLGQGFGDARSAAFSDFDNDGDLDLYVVNGGDFVNEPNRLYENNGTGLYTDVAEVAGVQAVVKGLGESVAVADYNDDGFMDMLVLNGLGVGPFSLGQRVLFQNQGASGNWLQIGLVGRMSNRDGIGAVVRLESGSLLLSRQQTGGVHKFSQNSQLLHLGLGNRNIVDRLTIHWPSGIVQQLSNIAVNQRIAIEEPKVGIEVIPDSSLSLPGETLGVTFKVTNHTDNRTGFYLASNVTLPDGGSYPEYPNSLFGPRWIRLAPYETKYVYITHDLPGDAPAGDYIYNGYVGRKPEEIWNEDYFKFTVGYGVAN